MGTGGGLFFKFTALIAIAVYVLLGSYTVQSGTAYIQDWSIDIASEEVKVLDEKPADGWIPYRVRDYFGYVQSDGSLLLRTPVPWNVALSEDTYCNYTRQGNNLVIRDPLRDYLYPLNIDGYPVERGGGYYVLSTDMTGLTAFSSTGEFGFSKEFSSLITSLDANETTVSVGLLSGGVELFNRDGSYRSGVQTDNSRIDVVYGTAISHDSNYLALVHGIDPQLLSLYSTKAADFRLMAQIELKEPTRSHTRLGFSPNGEYLLCEDGDRVLILLTREPVQEDALPLEGSLIDFEFLPEFESIYLLTSRNDRSILSIYSEEGRLYSREFFDGQAQWLFNAERALYIGSGIRLNKISIMRSSE
jgi:hypothetical protein